MKRAIDVMLTVPRYYIEPEKVVNHSLRIELTRNCDVKVQYCILPDTDHETFHNPMSH